MEFCHYGTYYDETLKSCQPCSRDCLACEKKDHCTNCASGKYLDGSSCKTSCRDGFKVQTGVAGVRLSNGVDGHVEILVNRTWTGICGDGWNFDNARVVCTHLGYGDVVTTFTMNFYYPRMLLKPRHCIGNEGSIFQCREGMLWPVVCIS